MCQDLTSRGWTSYSKQELRQKKERLDRIKYNYCLKMYDEDFDAPKELQRIYDLQADIDAGGYRWVSTPDLRECGQG